MIAVDLRGFGWSEAPRTGYEKEQLASDLLAVLDRLQIERVTWVGHDWGAWVGFVTALRAPQRIERMLGLAVPHFWVPRHPRQLSLLSYQGPISMPFLGPRVVGRMVPAILQSGRGPDRLSEADVELFASHVPDAVSVAMYRTFLTRELLPIARGRYARKQLEPPSKLVVGARDLVTRGMTSGPVPHQPQLEVEVLQGVAHWIPEQRPDVIIDWVTSSPAR